jgi:DNA-binding LacI/PurR family transcriptional regulator
MGHSDPEKQVVHIPHADWRLRVEDVQALLDDGVTGVICGDLFAIQMCEILKGLGKSVPGDISIVSIDNQLDAELHGLTAIGFGYDAVGRAAVQAWIERQEGRPAAECCKVIPVQLVERTSVGPAARS